MSRTALLTLGRFPKALTLARALNRAGIRVVVADPLKHHICSVSRAVSRSYKVCPPNEDIRRWEEDLLDIIEEENVTDVVPISEEVCHVSRLSERMPPSTRYFGPSKTWLQQWHDKLGFVEHAISRGVTAPSIFPTADPETRRILRQNDCVVKPRRGCSGTGVSFFSAGSAPPIPSNDMLLQRKVEGLPLCTLSWVEDGQVKATASYRGTTYSRTVAIGFQCTPTPYAVTQWIERFLADTATSGFISFDFIIDHAGIPWGIECNPRLSSGIHFLDEQWIGATIMGATEDAPPLSVAGKRAQWSYSVLTEAYKALFRFKLPEVIDCIRDLVLSRDVVWCIRDPLPFILMTPLCWELIWTSLSKRISIGDSSQRDIAWHWYEEDKTIPHTIRIGDEREA